ncbi:MAG: zeta toxin family protein [Hydrogenophaga sp.]|nr:zeta toxin family protein [Hydrogenophaga sp.]MDP1782371.1 zeta toxin family protein [Hydrogenophaga sp.]MDZ4130608.1 zeta toxin family protein [Hydrogenophaga sp.]
MTPPVFYLLAGPNGAGKSTLYRAAVADELIPADIEFVNADLYEAAELTQVVDPTVRSEQARQWADRRRTTLLAKGLSFVSETVFSHPSKLQLLGDARAAGFRTVLLVVCVDDPQQLVRRVAQRVREGGHAVPPDRILARYPRTLAHLKGAVRLADLALLYDTSGPAIQPPRLVARCRRGLPPVVPGQLPAWAAGVLAG